MASFRSSIPKRELATIAQVDKKVFALNKLMQEESKTRKHSNKIFRDSLWLRDLTGVRGLEALKEKRCGYAFWLLFLFCFVALFLDY